MIRVGVKMTLLKMMLMKGAADNGRDNIDEESVLCCCSCCDNDDDNNDLH